MVIIKTAQTAIATVKSLFLIRSSCVFGGVIRGGQYNSRHRALKNYSLLFMLTRHMKMVNWGISDYRVVLFLTKRHGDRLFDRHGLRPPFDKSTWFCMPTWAESSRLHSNRLCAKMSGSRLTGTMTTSPFPKACRSEPEIPLIGAAGMLKP
jgi:hypothetical protein